jgi:LmbE family N-acetylglucosaminyl deacetylase
MRYEYRSTSGRTLPFPTSALISEADLPSGQRVCCFTPHCDDVRFIGATLKTLHARNNLKIIVVASGHHAVNAEIPLEEKRTIRKNEMRAWGDALGLEAGCIHFLDAEATYDAKTVCPDDQARANRLFTELKPTLILTPQSDDVLQPINRCTNEMIRGAVMNWAKQDGVHGGLNPLIELKYPTLYAPFISFKKRNLNVIFSDEGLAEVKHRANKAFRSMARTFLAISERCIEAYDATCLSEFVFHYKNDCYQSPTVRPVNPNRMRCEHFSAAKITSVRTDETAGVRRELIRFPLNGEDMLLWSRNVIG